MSDTTTKLRCVLVYRLGDGTPTLLAKYDHAHQTETHHHHPTDNTQDELYGGGKDKTYAEAVGKVIAAEPPASLTTEVGGSAIGGFKIVHSDQHQVVYGADKDGICVGVITGLGYPPRVAYDMLHETYESFMVHYGKETKTTAKEEGALTKKAKRVLAEACTKYDDLAKVSKTHAISQQVDEVKSSIHSNIAGMYQNNAVAVKLEEKSEQLTEQALVFRNQSKKLKREMAWKNHKMTLIIGGVVVVILIVILIPVITLLV